MGLVVSSFPYHDRRVVGREGNLLDRSICLLHHSKPSKSKKIFEEREVSENSNDLYLGIEIK